MEDLTSKILKADFGAKKNLLNNIKVRSIVNSMIMMPFILYGVYSVLSPFGTNRILYREGGASTREVLLKYLLAERINYRCMLRPEIYYREMGMYDKFYAENIREFIGKDNKYKAYTWN